MVWSRGNALWSSSHAVAALLALLAGTDRCWAQTAPQPAVFAAPAQEPQQLRDAVRRRPGAAPERIVLPDYLEPLDNADARVLASYALRADLGSAPRATAIYLPGAFAATRIAVNGHVVSDLIGASPGQRNSGADRLVLAAVPAEFLHGGVNDIEVTVAGQRSAGLSTVWIGDEAALRSMRSRKLLWQVTGPLVASCVIIALSLCVLVLWARRPDQTLYGYFAIGGTIWALHTIWRLLPEPLLVAPHLGIWRNVGYGLFIAPLVVFCLRLAQWHLHAFERAMWILLAAGPVLFYAAHRADAFDGVSAYWRLAFIGAVAVGVYAVGIYAFRRRDILGMMLLAIGLVALAFGVHDWLIDRNSTDNNPIFLTSFSGLLFFPLVAWILIDGFVSAARDLERLNAELEHRVAEKSALLRHALDDMRIAKDGAEAANRAKSAFLAAASHDLRQPTHALGLYMAALRAESLPPKQGELVDRMTASIGALNAMFNGLLDISRMDAGALPVENRPFRIEPLLRRLADEFAREASDKGLRLSVRMGADRAGLNACSDPLLLERIVRNLLANAVKYTSEGGVLLACRFRSGPSQGRWRIEVWDTGPGIAAVDRDRIFDEFFQVGRAERDRAGGLGLGLSIVKRLAGLLGHRLWLDSTPGRGSRFVIELPATDEPVPAAADAAASGPLLGLGVGVLDDDPEVRQAMQVLLEGWGCVVVAAGSADELLGLAGSRACERLQALIVDYELSDGSNGIEAIEEVRRACGRQAPALIVSGASAPDRLRLLQNSGFDWAIKPAPPSRLRRWLVEAMQSLSPRAAPAPRATLAQGSSENA